MSFGIIQWSPGTTLEQVELQVVRAAYSFYKENKTATAGALGIAIRTLDTKLEKLGIDKASQEKSYEARQAERERQLARARGTVPTAPNNSIPISEAKAIASAEHGIRTKSVVSASEESALSMLEPEEIQSVLPTKIAAHGSGKRR
jgi:hypothetical protein